MLQIRFGLVAAIASLAFLGCASKEAPISVASPNNSTATASPKFLPPIEKTSETPVPAPLKVTKVSIGDIKDLANNQCNKSKVIYAYGETANYQVYICADAKEPDRPRYYISRNKDGSGGLDLEATNYNPQKSEAIEFNNDGYIYTLESPTTQNPEPVLRVTFPNRKLNEEKLLRYLSNSTTNSDAPNSNTPKSSTDPLAYILQNRESLGICKDYFEEVRKGMGSKAFQLTDQKYLVQIQCSLAAYQATFEYVLWIDQSPQPRVVPLDFDVFAEPKQGEPPKRTKERSLVGMPRVNVRSQTMTNFTKFRGLGDCGSSAIYKLEGDRLVLQEYRAKYECDGKYTQDFPIIYP
jgi:hypothetical protein